MTKKVKKSAYSVLMDKPGYLKWSVKKFKETYPVKYSLKEVELAFEKAKHDIKLGVSVINPKQTKNTLKSAKTPVKKFKRLFFDIETSPNIVTSWRVGYNLNIGPEAIIKERAIICVCWKWEGESKQYSLEWNKGCDKELLTKFVDVLEQADEICGHNSDKFDIKWLRARCYINNVKMFPTYKSIDTLKLSRSGFYFNSNKLDYLGKISGFGGKKDTGGMETWNKIIFDNCPKAMKKMVSYCHGDITLLEKVFKKLNSYTLAKVHVGVVMGKDRCSCTNCASSNTVVNLTRTMASGLKQKVLKCKDCGKIHSIPESVYNKIKGIK